MAQFGINVEAVCIFFLSLNSIQWEDHDTLSKEKGTSHLLLFSTPILFLRNPGNPLSPDAFWDQNGNFCSGLTMAYWVNELKNSAYFSSFIHSLLLDTKKVPIYFKSLKSKMSLKSFFYLLWPSTLNWIFSGFVPRVWWTVNNLVVL